MPLQDRMKKERNPKAATPATPATPAVPSDRKEKAELLISVVMAHGPFPTSDKMRELVPKIEELLKQYGV